MGMLDGVLGGRFGTVDKATFSIGEKQDNEGEWSFDNTVAVMLNPASIKVTASTAVKKEEGVANDSTPKTAPADGKICPKGIGEQQIEMTLIFNIVEAYEQKTSGADFRALKSAATTLMSSLGVSGGLGDAAKNAVMDFVKNTDYTNISILNPQLCCFTLLSMAAHQQLPVRFSWGNMRYTGFITRFAADYNYFSNQGAPLGADVDLVMVTSTESETQEQSSFTQGILDKLSESGLSRLLPGS